MSQDSQDFIKQELVHISRLFYERGWSLATSGNYSARIDKNRVLITTSGLDKGSMNESDTVMVDLQGLLIDELKPDLRPSAETILHCELYRFDPAIKAVLHTHSIYSTVISMQASRESHITLGGYEMLKALRGVSTHEHHEAIPIFPNSQNMKFLSQLAVEYLKANPDTHAFLIVGHGLYTWGRKIQEAKRHVEALEFLLECEYRKLMIRE